MGLALALRDLAEAVAERSGLTLDLHIEENCNDLPIGVEQGIYRMAQEALENISRHAYARCVKVELARRGTNLTFAITDDGRGFDPKTVRADGHFGLRGMYERAEMIGGRLEVQSELGKGTTIRLQVET
jgi:signal transduction histidine kinase